MIISGDYQTKENKQHDSLRKLLLPLRTHEMQRLKRIYRPAFEVILKLCNDLAVLIPRNVRKGNKTMYIFRVNLYLNVQIA